MMAADEGGGGGGGGGAAAGGGTRRAKTVSYQKFKMVERSLCVYLRGAEPEPGAGLLQADVIEWYLTQQEDIASVEALAAERRLVKQIIQRLVTADKVLMAVAPPEGAEERTDLSKHDRRYLSVRPHVEL